MSAPDRRVTLGQMERALAAIEAAHEMTITILTQMIELARTRGDEPVNRNLPNSEDWEFVIPGGSTGDALAGWVHRYG